MRTLPIAETSPAVAWLESTPREGHEPIRAELVRLPFTIGRNDSCDLTVESARISREHVRIEQESGTYVVRDLGSTNGTYVNGVKIKESSLTDGDLLTVANFGLIFHLPQSAARGQATQRFTIQEPDSVPDTTTRPSLKLIETVRALHETTLHRAARNRAQAVVEIKSGEAVGYELGRFEDASKPAFDPKFSDALECPALLRASKLSREVAVEQAWSHFGDVLMFISVGLREASTPDLIDSLDRLKQRPSGEARLVVQLPYELLGDASRFRDLRDQFREIGVRVAIDRFAGPSSSLEALRAAPPEYLKLAASMVQAADKSPDQGKQLQALVKAAAAMGVAIIGCGIRTESEWQACKSLEIPLSQGDFASAAMPLDASHGTK